MKPTIWVVGKVCGVVPVLSGGVSCCMPVAFLVMLFEIWMKRKLRAFFIERRILDVYVQLK
jgi:hypothetical protein